MRASHRLPARGNEWRIVVVEEVGDRSAIVRDTFGAEIEVSTIWVRVRKPEVGERWLIDRQYDAWTFAAVLEEPEE